MFVQRKRHLIANTLIGLTLLFSMAFVQINAVTAQSHLQDWSEPINLSNSGSTSDPQFVVDSNGIFHVLWKDEFDGYVYTQSSDGTLWSNPLVLIFPFEVTDSPPLLLPDLRGYVHAFWMDDESVFHYSRVLGAEFGVPGAWQSTSGLAESALDFDAVIDSTGQIHLSYIRPLSTDQFPSGIYYRKFSNIGLSWTSAIPLYESKYFRSLRPADAHVQISATTQDGEDYIYVAWDNRSIRRVFLTKSFDGGENWEIPVEVDGPRAGTITTAPFNIVVQPSNNNLLVIWQSGLQSGFDCNQYFQWSQDRGETWSERQLMLEKLVGCPVQNELFQATDGTTVLWTVIQDRVYLLAWNGSAWSDPVIQPPVNSFTNPDTLEGVNLRCRQPRLGVGDQLIVTGCDAVSTKDIWLTTYVLPSHNEWFPTADLWSTPEIISAAYTIDNPQVVYDSDGILHAFWSQLDDSSNESVYSIYYAQYVNDTWSQAVKVLSAVGNHLKKPSIAYDPAGNLMVVWESSESGEIFFSWALASDAINPFEWSKPASLPTANLNAGSPDIIMDNSGTIFVTHASKLNEGRGIYISKSSDRGSNWSNPITIFDAGEADWQLVDEPRLAITENGHLYVVWKRYSLTEDSAIGLYFATSEDGGESWSLPEMITDQSTTYADILGLGMQNVHRFWQSEDNSVFSLWHQASSDSGKNWSILENLSGFGETPIAFSITGDDTGRIYLVDAVEDTRDRFLVNVLSLVDETWTFEEVYGVEKTPEVGIKSVAIDLSTTGKLAVIFTQKSQSPDGESVENLYFSDRSVQLPVSIPNQEGSSETPPVQEDSTQEAELTLEPGVTVTTTITPTTDNPAINPGAGSGSPLPPISGALGLIAGVVLSVLLVGTVFLVGLYRMKRPG